jgi:hypothetical protein
MAQTRQQIDVRGPWADAVNRSQRRVRIVGRAIGERGERKVPAINCPGDGFQRPDFRRRQSKPRQASWTSAQNGGGIEWVERPRQPAPNCGRARRRQLLRHNDGGEARISTFAPAQRWPSCGREKLRESRVSHGE